MVLINTKLQKKFTNSKEKFNITEQNNIMNRFIFKKTKITYENYNDGFLYCFDNFNKIDDVLDILYKIKNSPSPLDYAICIQAGSDKTQLKKLADLQYFGKIVFYADTLLRYKCNNSHRYGTQTVGVFQQDDKSVEIHEFHEIL